MQPCDYITGTCFIKSQRCGGSSLFMFAFGTARPKGTMLQFIRPGSWELSVSRNERVSLALTFQNGNLLVLFLQTTSIVVAPGSLVGIATGYGLDDPWIESRWGGEIFRICPDRPWGPPSLLYNGYRSFPGGKERPGRDADPSPRSSAVVMKG